MTGRRQLLARIWRGTDDDGALAVQMLVAHAQARLDSQLRVEQGRDIRALGLLGADVAALGVLIAVHGAVNRFWWMVASGLGVAGSLLLVTVWPRKLDLGPSVRSFYEAFGSGATLDLARQMLAELLEATEANDRLTRTRKPEALIKVSLILIALSLAGVIPVALLG
jgi:hypothetical protein